MKAEFVNQEKPDVRITLSYKQAQKLLFVLLRVEGSQDIDDLWNILDDMGLDDLAGFRFHNEEYVKVIDDE